MKSKVMVLAMLMCLYSSISLSAQAIGVQWNTFLGSASGDIGFDIALDSSGNVYVTGQSDASWGSPVNAHSGNGDVFVACLDSSGNLLWNTFLGGLNNDHGVGIILDSAGNVYVTGSSNSSWGSPVNAYSGGGDAFVACLDSSGNLLWSTFLGCNAVDTGNDIIMNSTGNINVIGYSGDTWGSPVNAHSGDHDAFVACMDSSGNLIWNTFMGSTITDHGYGIIVGSSGNMYVIGYSYAAWGSPINAYSGGNDVFAACLNSSGSLLWNTFLGSSSNDWGYGITLDSMENIYVTGSSNASWGSPMNAHSGNSDAFLANLNSSGSLLWNTFMGSADGDVGRALIPDTDGHVYLIGYSDGSWGSPINPHSGNWDIFVAGLDSSGSLLGNTFFGSSGLDLGFSIALDSLGNIYVTGYSDASWGSPKNAHSGGNDVFVARISADPVPDIIANGSDGPISITQSNTLQIRVSLNTNGVTDDADFWLAYNGPSGWFHFNYSTKKWESGLGVTHQGPLMNLNNKKVFQKSGLAPGNYTFYFGVDMNMDAKVTKNELYYDEVNVTVTQ